MIIVRFELWSVITRKRTELARMMIANRDVSPDGKLGDYECFTYRGRSASALDKAMVDHLKGYQSGVTRKGKILQHPRLAEHVWNLVAKALAGMGYGKSNRKDVAAEAAEFFAGLTGRDFCGDAATGD